MYLQGFEMSRYEPLSGLKTSIGHFIQSLDFKYATIHSLLIKTDEKTGCFHSKIHVFSPKFTSISIYLIRKSGVFHAENG